MNSISHGLPKSVTTTKLLQSLSAVPQSMQRFFILGSNKYCRRDPLQKTHVSQVDPLSVMKKLRKLKLFLHPLPTASLMSSVVEPFDVVVAAEITKKAKAFPENFILVKLLGFFSLIF